MYLIFSECTDVQNMFHELSIKVMDKAFEKTKKIIQDSYPECQPKNAWNEEKLNAFKRCTNRLIRSKLWISEHLHSIEKFSLHNINSTIPTDARIWEQMEDATVDPFHSDGFEKAILFIKNSSNTIMSPTLTCVKVPGCQNVARKIILQLVMIEWGILGLGDASAGTFLAYHYPALGPYFGNIDKPTWPHSPLGNAPTELEYSFNQQMAKITEIISNGTLKNTSILDFPAFGSKVAWLRLQHKREPNWPTEVNFAILGGTNETMLTLFKNYKTLIQDWRFFMENLYRKDVNASFTTTMKNNYLFNFTSQVIPNMKAFLIATHGSFLTSLNQSLPVWTKIAKSLLNETRHESSTFEKSVYDKLVMICAFKQNIFQKMNIELDGVCKDFQPTLTTNGMCNTFNGWASTNIWKPSNITDAFTDMFSSKHSREVFHEENSGKFFLLFSTGKS